MSIVLVLLPPADGQLARMAEAIAHGVCDAGSQADIQHINVSEPDTLTPQLPQYDALVLGTQASFGSMSATMKTFMERTHALYSNGELVGKVASVFTSPGRQFGGQETTALTLLAALLQHGMLIIGLPYSFHGPAGIGPIPSGSPYGASAIPSLHSDRELSFNELAWARFQGTRVAQVSQKLSGH